MPICIAGMHRSGTSMVSRLINLCGLYIGPERELSPPAPDNPEGFWENVHFVAMNDKILTEFDAGWDLPPAASEGWELRPEINALQTEAADLIHRFTAHEPWGWKDPRNSLTLPFWMRLIPNLKVVICLRNPLEVALSLQARNFSSISFGLNLWLAYNQRILSAARAEDCLVTHYDAYFYAPRAELRRVLDFLNIPASEKEIHEACSTASANLRHQRVPIEVVSSEVPPEVLKCYLELCEQAGPVYQALGKNDVDSVLRQLDEKDGIVHARDETIVRLQAELSASREDSRQAADLNESLKAQVDESEKTINSRDEAIALLEHLLAEREQIIADRDHRLNENEKVILALDEAISLFENKLAETDKIIADRDHRLNENEKVILALDEAISLFENKLAETDKIIADRDHRLSENEKVIRARHEAISLLENKLAEADRIIVDRDHRLNENAKVIRARDEAIALLENGLAEAEKDNSLLSVQLSMKSRELNQITHSRGWRLLARYGRFKYRYLLPVYRMHGRFKYRYLLPVYRMLGLPAYSGTAIESNPAVQLPPELAAPVIINSSDEPLLSVIIPVFNQSRFSIGCLNSIKDVLEQSQLKVEVIVVDDASTDDTKEVLKQFIGVRTITNAENVGFIASCNGGAAAARGEYLLFLNNDTIVRPRCFEEILETFVLKPDAGLVGAKLLYPDGLLQEAGGIIWNDASGWNYGRMDDPEKPEYSYLREVDYCSGACLAVPQFLYQQLGGFDTRYSPAYCEDSDLAFKVRQAGYKVYYQPLAQVVHFEGMTCGKDLSENVKSYQVVNQQKLFAQWSTALATHGNPGANPYTAKERHVRKRILVVDAVVLTPDQDAGSLTVFNHIKIFQSLGYKVTFAPDNLDRDEKYSSDLQRLGVECLYYPHTKSILSHLEDYGSYYDIVFVARAGVAEAHIDNIRTYCHQAKVIFDTEDLHFLREARQAELENDAWLAEKALQRKAQELGIARKSDCTIVVSQYEKDVLLKEDARLNVRVIPVPRDVPGRVGEFEERSDILFIGGFRHPPNVDGILHFVQKIYPLIKKQLPDIRFYIIGSNMPAEVLDLSTDSSIIVTGYVADIAPYFNRCRLSVAPLRYGAGVKGKILTSLSYGLPVVASTIACEGIGLENNIDVLSADEPSDFAASVVRLYTDAALWDKLSANGLGHMRKNYSVSVTKTAFQQLFRSLAESHKTGFASSRDERNTGESKVAAH